LKSFELMEIPYFDKVSQLKISKILSSFDYEIDKLRCINDNLEELSTALFQSYFLTGDEVSFTTIANFQNGLAMQKFRPNDDQSLPVLKIKELGNGYCDKSSDRCRVDVDQSVIIQDGDIVFSWSGSLMAKVWCGGRCGLNQHLYKVTSAKYPKWFINEWLQLHMPDFIDIAANKATTMGHITRKHLDDAIVLIPPSVIWDVYAPLMNAIFDMRIKCMKEIVKLQGIRDYLLPKLMTGEVDVSSLTLPTKYSFDGLSGYILLMCIFNILLIHHCIMECRIYPNVAKNLLNLLYWHPLIDCSGGHCPPEFVRMYVLNRCDGLQILQHRFHSIDADSSDWIVKCDEKSRIIVRPMFEILLEMELRSCIEIDLALAFPFSENDAFPFVEINIRSVKSYQLAYTDTC